eukprot:5622869-Pyramimonas_sp.AAC.1
MVSSARHDSPMRSIFAMFPTGTAVSITWAYEICLVHLSSEPALLDVEPVVLRPSVVDHADQVQHSECLACPMAVSGIPANRLQVFVALMATSLRWPLVEQH